MYSQRETYFSKLVDYFACLCVVKSWALRLEATTIASGKKSAQPLFEDFSLRM